MPFKNPSPEYAIWQAMKQRCLNPKNKWYKSYGGRGIKICDSWINRFDNFISDMGNRPEGHSLERVDNDRGYSPINCVWADKSTQSANQRKRCDNKTGYTGVYKREVDGSYFSRVQFKNKIIYNKTFKTISEAVYSRNKFIIENNLPHKIEEIT